MISLLTIYIYYKLRFFTFKNLTVFIYIPALKLQSTEHQNWKIALVLLTRGEEKLSMQNVRIGLVRWSIAKICVTQILIVRGILKGTRRKTRNVLPQQALKRALKISIKATLGMLEAYLMIAHWEVLNPGVLSRNLVIIRIYK